MTPRSMQILKTRLATQLSYQKFELVLPPIEVYLIKIYLKTFFWNAERYRTTTETYENIFQVKIAITFYMDQDMAVGERFNLTATLYQVATLVSILSNFIG